MHCCRIKQSSSNWPDCKKTSRAAKHHGENLHLTLAFLGNQPVSAISGLTDFLDHTEFAPFRLSLDKTGYFPKIRLSWIGPTRIPKALDKLHETTRQFLIPAYIENKKETFRPHITLARQSVYRT